MKRDSVNRFVVVRFDEHIFVDFRKQAVKVFDVTSQGNRNFSSDFLTSDGDFDHEQYCKCLIESAFGLPEDQLSSFLDYQCAQLKLPDHWLLLFETLLDCNKELVMTFEEMLLRKLNLLTQLLKEKRVLHSRPVGRKVFLFFNSDSSKREEERFKIVKVKKELEAISTHREKLIYLNRCSVDYLQEVEDDENAAFIKSINREIEYLIFLLELGKGNLEVSKKDTERKKITFAKTPTQLANLIGQMREIQEENEDLIFDGSTMDFTRLICNNFCKSDGSLFMENSIRAYLTSYQNRKSAPRKNQIDVSKIRLLEE